MMASSTGLVSIIFSSVAKMGTLGHVPYQLGVVPYHWRCALPTLNNYPKLPRAQRSIS